MDIIYINSLKAISAQKVHNQANYGLIAIDMFTLRAFGEVMPRKRASDALEAFKKMLNDSKKTPSLLHVDQGSEFLQGFLAFCKGPVDPVDPNLFYYYKVQGQPS